MLLTEFIIKVHKTGRSLNEMTIKEIIELIDIISLCGMPDRYIALIGNIKLSLMTKVDMSEIAAILGKKGGQSKSTKKKKSSAANLIKARAKKKKVS